MVANPGLGCQLSLGRTPTAGRVPKRISVRRGRGHRGVSSRDPLPQASSCPVPAKRWLNGHPVLRKRLKGLEPIDGRPPPRRPPCESGDQASQSAARDWRPSFDHRPSGQRALAISIVECRRCTPEARPIHAVVLFLHRASPDVGAWQTRNCHGISRGDEDTISPDDGVNTQTGMPSWKTLCHGGIVSPPARLALGHFIPPQVVWSRPPRPALGLLASEFPGRPSMRLRLLTTASSWTIGSNHGEMVRSSNNQLEDVQK